MKLTRLENESGEFHGYNSLPFAYLGNGLLLKPLYQKSQGEWWYVRGFELFYFGEKVHLYYIPKEIEYDKQKQIEFMETLAKQISQEMAANE